MNKKVKNNYEQLARHTGLRFDEKSGILYGRRGEYELTVHAENEKAPYILNVAVCAVRLGEPLTKEECKQFRKEYKPVSSLNQKGNLVVMTVSCGSNARKMNENLENAIGAFVSLLYGKGFRNCCQTCGIQTETDAVITGNAHMLICPDCFSKLQQSHAIDMGQKERKKDHILGGIIGAFIGSLLGVLCIVILGQLGYVAAVSGLVMAVCTMKGYELLGGKLSTRGIAIGVVLMILMTYVGNRLDWAIEVAIQLDVDIITSFRIIPLLLDEGILDHILYWGNLALVYIFALLGAIPTVGGIVKEQKSEDVFYRLETEDREL